MTYKEKLASKNIVEASLRKFRSCHSVLNNHAEVEGSFILYHSCNFIYSVKNVVRVTGPVAFSPEV